MCIFFDSTSGRGRKCANALQTKNIGFLARKCSFLKPEECLDVAWERKILIFLQDNVHFYDSTSGRGQKCANALQTKNIDFPAGECAFLQTEEDLDLFWERKILIFLQGNVNF